MLIVQPWDGKKITRPGIYADIPIERYHGDICDGPSISSTGLRRMMKSPAHFWDTSIYNPDAAEDEESASIVLGRMAHHLLFGEKDFQKQFIVRPDKTPQGDPWHHARVFCKTWTARQREKGLTVYTRSMLEQVRGMANSLQREPLVQAGILNGEIERSWFWKDAETGIWLKTRPDATPTDALDFADLKTAHSIDEGYLQKSLSPRGNGYFQQGALVAMGCHHLLKKQINSFSFVFVESKRPHCVEIITMKDNDIALGIRANRYALHRFADCLKTGNWPGPSGGRKDARYLEMREWDQKELHNSLKIEGF